MTGIGEGLPRAGVAVPSGKRSRNRFLAVFLVLAAAGALLLLAGFREILRLPLEGGYGDVFRALRLLEERLPLHVALLLAAWSLLLGGAVALLCVHAFRNVAAPMCRLERAADDLASGDPLRPVRFRSDDAGGELAEAYNGFVEALRRDREACLSRVAEARRAAAGGEGGREGARAALREISTTLAHYR